jgi:hypothetical protein
MWYFGVKLSLFQNKKLIIEYYNEKCDDEYFKTFYKRSSLEQYVLFNLYFRLSLDSKSRAEIENITTNIIKKNIELQKRQELEQQKTTIEE